MKQILSLVGLFLSLELVGQSLVISGKVLDKSSREKLVGVNCFNETDENVIRTNQDGYFSISSKSSHVKLRFSYVGYNSKDTTFTTSTYVEIDLTSGLNLNEVSVSAENKLNPAFTQITTNQIRQLPGILGESDVLKTLAFQPGVMSGTEGSASIFVRGGGGDQNLVLWDDAILYNVNHLGGFFSIFNPLVVKNLQFYKSYIPPNFGGRGSSVIAINTREGNRKKTEGEIEIGILNQNISIEGPLKKGNSSFIASGRYSNLGIIGLIRQALPSSSQEFNNISFYDFSGRVNTKIGQNSELVYSVFSGADQYKYNESFAFTSKSNLLKWNNFVQSLKFTQVIGKQLFFKSHISQTIYKSTMQFEDKIGQDGKTTIQGLTNQITDWSGKINLEYFPSNRITLDAGGEFTRHKFQPYYFNALTETSKSDSGTLFRTLESSLFFHVAIEPIKRLKADIGVRRSGLFYDKKWIFTNWEPRFQIQYLPNSTSTFYLSYTKMTQYLHSLSSTGTGFNVEVWVPSIIDVPPLNVSSFSVGYQKKMGGWKFGQELYSKNFTNLIMYQEGENISIFQGFDWVNQINTKGRGISLGLENHIHFTQNKLNMNISYTWSRTNHQFIGINNNQTFPFKFDRRHYLTLQTSLQWSKKWNINTAFVLQSGQAFTSPTGVRPSSNPNNLTPVFFYTSINNSRFPLYHRLDVGLNYSKKSKGNHPSTWSFGAFNIYNQQNPAYLDIQLIQENNKPSYQVVPIAFLPIIPYVKYALKF